MRLSDKQIKEIQHILKHEFGQDCTDERAQEVGFAVLRFIIAKAQCASLFNKQGEEQYE